MLHASANAIALDKKTTSATAESAEENLTEDALSKWDSSSVH